MLTIIPMQGEKSGLMKRFEITERADSSDTPTLERDLCLKKLLTSVSDLLTLLLSVSKVSAKCQR
jgi:hypothetical protein